MSRTKILLVTAFMFLCTAIYADVRVNYAPTPGSMGSGKEGKNPGDIISLGSDGDIAAFCDFNKAIVVTRTSTLCAYNGKQ